MDKETIALVEDVRKSLVAHAKTQTSASAKKKTRKITSQVIWEPGPYLDELDNILSTAKTKTEAVDRVRSLVRSSEEAALDSMTLLPDDTGHHKVQSRTGGDDLTELPYNRTGPIIKRLSDKHKMTFGNTTGPTGNLTAELSLSNAAHKFDDRSTGLERESGIGKVIPKDKVAHNKGTAAYANMKGVDLTNDQAVYTALDNKVTEQVNQANIAIESDAPRQKAIRDLTGDPLTYGKDANPADVAKTKQSLLTVDPKKIKQSYLKLTNGGVSFNSVIPWFDYLEPLDQMTGGHIESTIDKGVNVVRQSLGFKPNPVGHTPVKDPITSFGNGVARRIWDVGNMLSNQTNPYPAEIK
jgi:hypothetical protein